MCCFGYFLEIFLGIFNCRKLSIYFQSLNNTGNCNHTEAIFDTSQFTSTVPSEFHLACGRTSLNSLATSLSFIGLFFGAMFAGYFSDKYGRKLTIVISIALNVIFWVLQGWIPTYPMFVILRILVQGSNQAAYLTYNCYGKEQHVEKKFDFLFFSF